MIRSLTAWCRRSALVRRNATKRLVKDLAAADGAGGARAEGDDGANSAGARVGGVNDAEGAEHALSLATVLGDGARGPGSLGGAAEVGAVVPGGGGVAVDGGRVRYLGRGPVRGEEGLEVQDVVELHRWCIRVVREAAGSRGGQSSSSQPGSGDLSYAHTACAHY